MSCEVESKGKGLVSVWLTELIWTALPAMVLTFLRHGRYALYFTSASRGGLALAWLLRAMGVLASPARRVEFTLHGLRVDDAQSPRLFVQAWGPNEFTARFFETHRGVLEGLTYPDSRVRPDRILTNLRKAACETSYQLLTFLAFARYRHQIEEIPSRRLVVLSPTGVLANLVSPGWAGQDVEFISPWSKHHSLLLRLGRGILRCLVESVRWRRPRPEMPPAIGAEAAWGLGRSKRLNDLFWWWDSGIPAGRVVLYFDRQDTPANREMVACAERLGIRCVVLDRQAVGDSPHLLWRPAPGPATSIRRLWRVLRMCVWGLFHGAVGRWVACRLLDTLHEADRLEDFMRDFNVRGLFHSQETNQDYPSVACDAAGSARIGVHWSHFPWPEVKVARLHQVYFAWGQHSVRMLETLESCVDHLLLSGCIVRGAYLGGGGRDGMQRRALVTAHGAKRVLTIFDMSFPCEAFYDFFLRRIVQDPRWGLLIKPKGPMPWERWRLPELKALCEQALATGRVRLLDKEVSPAEAAAAADFAVGVDINSATVVAMLAGHKAVHLDYNRLHASPLSDWADFYRDGPDRLVFDDPKKLWESLNCYFDEPGRELDLGVVDEGLLREIDPFRDGRAGQRIGDYLRWYLEGLDQGLKRDSALEQANRRYAGRWGSDAVVCGLSRIPTSAHL